jgi:hypothetical protein
VSRRDGPITEQGSGLFVQMVRRSLRYIEGRNIARALRVVGQLDGRFRLSPQLSGVGFLGGKEHLVHLFEFCLFLRNAGPRLRHEAAGRQATLIEQRSQE